MLPPHHQQAEEKLREEYLPKSRREIGRGCTSPSPPTKRNDKTVCFMSFHKSFKNGAGFPDSGGESCQYPSSPLLSHLGLDFMRREQQGHSGRATRSSNQRSVSRERKGQRKKSTRCNLRLMPPARSTGSAQTKLHAQASCFACSPQPFSAGWEFRVPTTLPLERQVSEGPQRHTPQHHPGADEQPGH